MVVFVLVAVAAVVVVPNKKGKMDVSNSIFPTPALTVHTKM